jgi:hypothetical protein
LLGVDALRERRAQALAPERGVAQWRRIVELALASAAAPRAATNLELGLRALRAQVKRRAVLVLFSDFRDERLLERSELLAELARRHDLVAAALLDRLELALPKAGTLRVSDPERPGALRIFDTSRRRSREAWLAACATRRARLAHQLRRAGADLVWLRNDQSPLHALAQFLRDRAGRRPRLRA